MSDYEITIKTLKSMTQDQLTELMNDIDDEETIKLIWEEADYWIDLQKIHANNMDDYK